MILHTCRNVKIVSLSQNTGWPISTFVGGLSIGSELIIFTIKLSHNLSSPANLKQGVLSFLTEFYFLKNVIYQYSIVKHSVISWFYLATHVSDSLLILLVHIPYKTQNKNQKVSSRLHNKVHSRYVLKIGKNVAISVCGDNFERGPA